MIIRYGKEILTVNLNIGLTKKISCERRLYV